MAGSSASDQSFERIYDCTDDYVAECIVADALCGAYATSHDEMEAGHSKKVKQEQTDRYDFVAPISVPVIGITQENDCCESRAKILKKSSGCSENDGHYLRISVSHQIVTTRSLDLITNIPPKAMSSTSDLGVNDDNKMDRRRYCLHDQPLPDLCKLNPSTPYNSPCSSGINQIDVEKSKGNLVKSEEEGYNYASSSPSGFSNVYTEPNYPDELCRKHTLLGLLEYELSERLGGLNLDESDISTMSVDTQGSVMSENIPAPFNSNNDDCRTPDMETDDIFKQEVPKKEDDENILRFIKSKVKNVFEEVRSVLQLGDHVSKRAHVLENWAMLQERRVMETEADIEEIDNYLRDKEHDWDRMRQEFKSEINYLANTLGQVWRFVLKNDSNTKEKTASVAEAQAEINRTFDPKPKKGRANKKLTEELLAQLLLHRHWKDHRPLVHEINRVSQITQLKLLIFNQQSHIRYLEQQHVGLNAFMTEIGNTGCSVEDLIVHIRKRFPLVFNDKKHDLSHLHHVLHCDCVNNIPRKSPDMDLNSLRMFQIGDYNKGNAVENVASFQLLDVPYIKRQTGD